LAFAYREADKQLETVCNTTMDPIACTVFALKQKHLEDIPKEGIEAGIYLRQLLDLHQTLIKDHGMDPDCVRDVWFPILNDEINQTK
jgi:hypothetical protein